MKINYQKELDKIILDMQRDEQKKSLLLHSCCAPCSSYVLEYLSNFFDITVYYYNPNIYPEQEFVRRVEEQKKFIGNFKAKNPISFIEGEYQKERFYNISKGLEDENEGGERCTRCYELRLRETAIKAKEGKFDYFTTTLSISPHKNAQRLNSIGKTIEEEYGVKYLYSDFKKKEGFKRSIELSNIYGLYRQNYCGCVFSRNESEKNPKHQ